ncbi:MAG: ISAzo13 family transposase [Anaerolineae bacterium]|nr:ISAzo13 family transposase [Anaerolineae bacterium]
MGSDDRVKAIAYKYGQLNRDMNERLRRRWAGSEAEAYGLGGISAVSRATGLAWNTVKRGMAELHDKNRDVSADRVRRAGGGRKELIERDTELMAALERLIDPVTRGDPESPLRWTCKSTYQLSSALSGRRPISPSSVGRLLKEAGYSLQSNQKALEGSSHPDRNEQFENISKMVRKFQQRGQPVISVDTKKKELVGQFYRGGREWHPEGKPERVRVHDFVDKELGKAIPYGVYDITNNKGWVSVGIDHDTAEFAAAAIQRWWKKLGAKAYPGAQELMLTADGGGSNGSRNRLWKVSLQRLSTHLGIPITVCHFPPGTSKWNKIEHRMFSFISQNWRGRPLVSHEIIVQLIAQTATEEGLRIDAELDTATYQTGIKVSDDEMALLRLQPATFHGDWNYRILPKT